MRISRGQRGQRNYDDSGELRSGMFGYRQRDEIPMRFREQ